MDQTPNAGTPENAAAPAAPTAPVTPTTAAPAPSTDTNLLMGILCYLGPLVIIPYLMAKEEPFVKFHLKQGIVLAGIELVIYILSVSMLFWHFWFILSLVNLGCLIFSIIGIIYVVQKKETALPLIGGLAAKIAI